MTLDNLVGNTLERIDPDPDGIRRLLEAAERNLVDARIDYIAAADALYKVCAGMLAQQSSRMDMTPFQASHENGTILASHPDTEKAP